MSDDGPTLQSLYTLAQQKEIVAAGDKFGHAIAAAARDLAEDIVRIAGPTRPPVEEVTASLNVHCALLMAHHAKLNDVPREWIYASVKRAVDAVFGAGN